MNRTIRLGIVIASFAGLALSAVGIYASSAHAIHWGPWGAWVNRGNPSTCADGDYFADANINSYSKKTFGVTAPAVLYTGAKAEAYSDISLGSRTVSAYYNGTVGSQCASYQAPWELSKSRCRVATQVF